MAEVVVAYSDCLDIKPTHNETNLIEYSNESDFANISFSGSVRPVFGIRVHSKFFKERYPEENESDEFDEDVVKLSGSVKAQKLLQIEPVPYFMHRILKLALQCNYISIDSTEWLKEESYDMKEMNEKFPMEPGETWLTAKGDNNFINTYGTV